MNGDNYPSQEPFLGFQVAQIENGFMVQQPGITLPNGQVARQPISHYCADRKEVLDYVGTLLPTTITLLDKPSRR